MKHRDTWWAVLPLLVPVILFVSVVAPWGCGGGGGAAATAAATQGNVAIGFVAQLPSGSNFNSFLLNISSVRINAHPDATVSSSNWVTIPVPSGFGGAKGSGPGDLQIDLNTIRSAATLFNTLGVPVNTYAQLQLVVDPNIPGTVVPACQGAGSGQEGCAAYPIVFSSPITTTPLIVKYPVPFSVSNGGLTPEVIQIGISQATFDPSSQTYTVTPEVTAVDAGSFLGLVSGTVTHSGSAGSHLLPQTVTAELAGTNTIVAQARVVNGNYTLELPGAPDTGTAYDLFVSGGGFGFDTTTPGSPINVKPGLDITQNFSVKGASIGSITGAIADTCTGLAVQGATLQLLAPPSGSSIDCSVSGSNCVSVATTSTDDLGKYPLPGTHVLPPPFDELPTGDHNFGIEISASGYQTILTTAQATSGKPSCGAPASTDCNFSLEAGQISGTVTLAQAPLPAQSVEVQVFAENSGTDELVSALPAPLVFQPAQTSLPFTLNVPPGGTFDLFAAAIDPFLGSPDPFPGHTIEVAPAVAGPAAACQAALTSPTIGPLDCAGHGSVTGTTINPDSETTVEVLKGGVQLFGTNPGLFSAGGNNEYTLCMPPGDYELERFENGVPGATASVTVPEPAATSTPCPSTCSIDSGTCPGECATTSGPTL